MRRVRLTQNLIDVLEPALGRAKSDVMSQYVNNEIQAYQTENDRIITLLRFERSELVIVALAGSGLRQVREEIMDFAISRAMHSIRFHTLFPERLEKGLSGLDFRLEARGENEEYIYRLGIL